MKFDRFLAKLFSRKGLIIISAALIILMFLPACKCTEDDFWMCVCFGCVTPKTCESCMDDCTNTSCRALNGWTTDIYNCLGCGELHDEESSKELSESCVGKCAVNTIGSMSDSCED